MLAEAPATTLQKLLFGKIHGQVHRIFGTSGAGHSHWLLGPDSYSLLAKNEEWWEVFTRIIEKLTEVYATPRGCRLDVETFLSQPVPIAPTDGRLGWYSIAWFDQWIRWGTGIPAPVYGFDLPARSHRPPVSDHLLKLLTSESPRLQHRRIVNVSSKTLGTDFSEFGPAVAQALTDPSRVKVAPGSTPSGTPASQCREAVRDLRQYLPPAVVYVRLTRRETRRSVLKKLYEAFNLPTGRLEDLERRPVDLSSDLELVRRALAINEVVLIFDAWDNVAGPFGVLHDFLCHTHWREYIRGLAQPHLQTLCQAPTGEEIALRYCLLVISRYETVELNPWVRKTTEVVPLPGDVAAGCTGTLDSAPRCDTAPRPVQDHATVAEITRLEAELESCEYRTAAWQRLVVVMARRLVAASINGIRRATLRRCLEYWHSQFWPEIGPLQEDDDHEEGDLDENNNAKHDLWSPARVLNDAFNELRGLSDLLCEEDEEELESLPNRFRSLELERRPTIAEDSPELLAFASSSLRSEFISGLLEDESRDPRATRCSWAHANYLLAQECLRQGTAQLRHLSTDSIDSPYAVRRIVQAIYHGLVSLRVKEPTHKLGVTSADPGLETYDTMTSVVSTSLPSGLYAPMLPADENKRYRYLYSFLYRSLVEANLWKLGRSFGRPDIRLDLLTIFVRPSLGSGMLVEQPDSAAAGLPDPSDLQDIADGLKRDWAIWSDLLESVGRSGCDLGGDRGDAAVRWALRLLPNMLATAQANALLPPRSPGGAYYQAATAALKLRIDWRQSKGKIQEVKKLCLEELKRLGIEGSAVSLLEEQVGHALEAALAPAGVAFAADEPHAVRERLRRAFGSTHALFLERLRDAEQFETASAILFRLAEALALEADESVLRQSQRSQDRGQVPTGVAGDSPEVQQGQVRALALAFAVCWLADSLRSEAGATSSREVGWPRAGGRSMRVYIRVCLDLARLLNEVTAGHETESLRNITRQLLEHAQNRLGLYTRHNHGFRRERLPMLLLEVHRVRTWVGIEKRRLEMRFGQQRLQRDRAVASSAPTQKDKARARFNRQLARTVERTHAHWHMLITGWNILDEAEKGLFSLGCQPKHARDLLLERIRTSRTLVSLMKQYDSIYFERRNFPTDSGIQEKLLQAIRYHRIARDLHDVLYHFGNESFFWSATSDAEGEKLRTAETELIEIAKNRGVSPVFESSLTEG